MTNTSLAESYLIKARVRLEVLAVYLDKEAYSDVVREAQEIVELALKGMLRQVGMGSRPTGTMSAGSFASTATGFRA